ncbi:hypothetical protein HKBW3C_01696 [Candidatus Hakubella thermalkaliphila]|nr:hypothetical protein HKBW3C_01696 [Candidatus Hakubella thermalkaliphila]
MIFIADFHIHSRYSRAVSPDMDIDNLARWATIKGIKLMGTGDFTHPLWLAELKEKLKPTDNGLFSCGETHFILTGEVNSIYTQSNKPRRIHNLIFAPSFEAVERINKKLLSRGARLRSDGRPIVGLSARDLVELVMDASPQSFIVPAHAWTPWYSVFGTKSGFDSLEECFGDMRPYIQAIETGLSSDPAMNWRISGLDQVAIISCSDSHSPRKIGREAAVFDTELNYTSLIEAMRGRRTDKLLYTIEFFPQEGKYHYDGHRLCGIHQGPRETLSKGEICPVCGRRLTIGVMNRVEQLADRPEGFVPERSSPFKSLVPLEEIIAESLDVGQTTKTVETYYQRLIARFGSEFEVLLNTPIDEIKDVDPQIGEGVDRVRKGQLHIEPGYDGVSGKIRIFGQEERIPEGPTNGEQLSLL